MSGILPIASSSEVPRSPKSAGRFGVCWPFHARERSSTKPYLTLTRLRQVLTVHLRNGDKVQTFTIVEDSESSLLSGDLSPSDSLARKLIGLKQGARVVLREGLEDLAYEIIDIQSKYVFAFQETLLNFSTWFPDHTGLFRVEVKGGDVSKVKLALYARQRHGAQVLRLFTETKT